MGYPRRLGGYLPSNLNISGPVVSGGAITGSTLVATSAGAAATPPVKAGASGVGFYEVAANVLGLSTGAAVVMSLGGGNAAVLEAFVEQQLEAMRGAGLAVVVNTESQVARDALPALQRYSTLVVRGF